MYFLKKKKRKKKMHINSDRRPSILPLLGPGWWKGLSCSGKRLFLWMLLNWFLLSKTPSKKQNVNSLYFETVCQEQFFKKSCMFLQIHGSIEWVNIFTFAQFIVYKITRKTLALKNPCWMVEIRSLTSGKCFLGGLYILTNCMLIYCVVLLCSRWHTCLLFI